MTDPDPSLEPVVGVYGLRAFRVSLDGNTGYANALAAVERGAGSLDASAGGIGGCPFAPAATGNVATEDLLYLLHRSGLRTGIDPQRLMDVLPALAAELGHPVSGQLSRAGWFPAPES